VTRDCARARLTTTAISPHPSNTHAPALLPAAESPIVFIGTGEHFDDFEVFQHAHTYTHKHAHTLSLSLSLSLSLFLSYTRVYRHQVFEVRSFVSRLLGMGDVGGLMNAIKDAGLDKQPELYQKLSQGVFTLR
jgi:signal recognition particle subunit SRP54